MKRFMLTLLVGAVVLGMASAVQARGGGGGKGGKGGGSHRSSASRHGSNKGSKKQAHNNHNRQHNRGHDKDRNKHRDKDRHARNHDRHRDHDRRHDQDRDRDRDRRHGRDHDRRHDRDHDRFYKSCLKYGKFGPYFRCVDPCPWWDCSWSSTYGCNVYFDEECSRWFYLCEPDECFYPVSHCPYGRYVFTEREVETTVEEVVP
jgi:hypothetical protein